MPTTHDILEDAKKLGQQVDQHESAQKLKQALSTLESDQQAQQTVQDLNTHMNSLAQKQQAGSPIEVEDKQKMQELQQQVAMSTVLRDFQQAQMDYLDLLRKVDDAITSQSEAQKAVPSGNQGAGGQAGQAGNAGPILTPGMGG